MPPNPTAPTTSADALTNLNSFNASAKTPDQILTEQNQAAGVDAAQQTLTGLRGAISNTTNLLRQVAPSIMGRTANSLVTSAQATRQIGNEQAPIQQNLQDEGTQYGNATQDYQTATDKAKTATDLLYQGQQDKMSYLQNLYSTLYGNEQDAAKMAEAKREFDTTTAANAKAAGSGSFNLGGLGSPTSTATKPQATYTPKVGGGFAFTAPNGQAISAAQYSQITGIPFISLLKDMANKGDQGAKTALTFVGNDYGYDPGKIGSNAGIYNSLVWGTGRQYSGASPINVPGLTPTVGGPGLTVAGGGSMPAGLSLGSY